MKTRNVTLTLQAELDRNSRDLSDQLVALIRRSISNADVLPGDRLPPSRQLASELGIARGTVTAALDLLVAEGLLEAKTGSGTYVSAEARFGAEVHQTIQESLIALPKKVPQPNVDMAENAMVDFRPCRPSLEAFPRAAWRRCISWASSIQPSADYGDPQGDLQLRQEIVRYLRRARGLNLTTDQIIISNGAVHAMHLLSSLYLDNRSRVVVENPGYPLAHQTFQMAGASIIPCPVDEDGIDLNGLPRNSKDIRFVYLTPSHQFPTGSRLSLSRRRALIEWAEHRGIVIIEDDYDGEFRFDVAPLAPLVSMANGCVVYCGTFSKTLFPGLRIGFAVAPTPLIKALTAFRTIAEYAPNALLQAGLARFIAEGHYERHIHRMRRIYANKRRVLAQSLKRLEFTAELQGLDSGLHALVKLEQGYSASRLSASATKAGILVPHIRRYALNETVADDALVVGYAALSAENIEKGVAALSTGNISKYLRN